jgi:hypothetical protein
MHVQREDHARTPQQDSRHDAAEHRAVVYWFARYVARLIPNCCGDWCPCGYVCTCWLLLICLVCWTLDVLLCAVTAVFMYVCMYVCMCVCVCMYIHMYVLYACMYVCMCCMYLCICFMYVCMYVCICMYVCMCFMYLCICCRYVCVYVCMYIQMYVLYACMHVCMYVQE